LALILLYPHRSIIRSSMGYKKLKIGLGCPFPDFTSYVDRNVNISFGCLFFSIYVLAAYALA